MVCGELLHNTLTSSILARIILFGRIIASNYYYEMTQERRRRNAVALGTRVATRNHSVTVTTTKEIILRN